jgi:regulator of extracellular matrix RemA (YlzA/DUF370 family)
MRFINAGFGNLVAAERIITIASPEAAPIKRMVQDGKEEGRVIDVSCGKKTKSVIFCDSDHIVLSALTPEKLLHAMSEDEGTEEE